VTRPSGDAPDRRAYLALRALARRTGRPTAEVIQLYVLERFVARVGASEHRDRLVLKGGLLMAAFGARRPTRDVDLLAVDVSNEVGDIKDLVRDIAAIDLDDGVWIDPDDLEARAIREGGTYAGIRVRLRARLATARVAFHVDVNVGDPVDPPPHPAHMPALLDGPPLSILAYPVEMVIAEKLVTALERGGTSTRWRDFVDLFALARMGVPDDRVARSVRRVAEHRDVSVEGFARLRDEFGSDAQVKWDAWRRKATLGERVPEAFADLLDTLAPWVERLLTSVVEQGPS